MPSFSRPVSRTHRWPPCRGRSHSASEAPRLDPCEVPSESPGECSRVREGGRPAGREQPLRVTTVTENWLQVLGGDSWRTSSRATSSSLEILQEECLVECGPRRASSMKLVLALSTRGALNLHLCFFFVFFLMMSLMDCVHLHCHCFF